MPSMCRKRVGEGTVTYGCIIEIPDGMAAHLGPCASRENSRSLRVRREWEEARATLAATQGPAQTFHESMGEPGGGTGVPGSGLSPQEHRAQHQPRVGEEGEITHEQQAKSIEVEREAESKPRRGRVQDSLATHVESAFAPVQPMSDEIRERAEERIGEGLRQREGDQRLPVEGFGPIAHVAVQEDLEKRLQVGIGRYGKPLQAGNGRNSFQDAYEEVLDQSVYMKVLLIERDHYAMMLRDALGEGSVEDLAEVAAEVAAWLGQ